MKARPKKSSRRTPKKTRAKKRRAKTSRQKRRQTKRRGQRQTPHRRGERRKERQRPSPQPPVAQDQLCPGHKLKVNPEKTQAKKQAKHRRLLRPGLWRRTFSTLTSRRPSGQKSSLRQGCGQHGRRQQEEGGEAQHREGGISQDNSRRQRVSRKERSLTLMPPRRVRHHKPHEAQAAWPSVSPRRASLRMKAWKGHAAKPQRKLRQRLRQRL